MSKQVGYLILFNARTFWLSCQPVPVNRCCFSSGLCLRLNQMGYCNYPKSAIVIVVCPLNALIECHMKELRQRGISCTCLSGDDADQDGALAGKYTFVFANPEALILNKKWRKMLQSPIYQSKLFGIVTDEAHVIPKWYVDECCCGLNLLSF